MFSALKRDAALWIREFREKPLRVLLFPCILLFFAFLFRIFAGRGVNLYRLFMCRGIFPGTFMYFIGYILRILCAGLMLTGVFFCRGLYERRLRAAVFAAAVCFALLSEYKLIFVSVSPVFALLLCIAAVVAAFFCLTLFLKTCCPGVLPSLLFLVFQTVFCVQLLSLCIAM